MKAEIDPAGQIRVLTQALGNMETRLGFLLGAGCACSVRDVSDAALIPATAELTARVCAELKASARAEAFGKIEKYYVDNGSASLPNIEELLSKIRALRDIAGVTGLFGLSGKQLDDLDDGICRSIEKIVDRRLPLGESSYAAFARWIKEIDRHKPVEVFTTNYDLLLEEALERVRAPYFDGFVGSYEPFFDVSAMELDRLPERWTRLWKVHGSISWRLADSNAIVRGRDGTSKPLIFPSHLKYAESRRLPYLAMRDRLRAFVKERPVFLTCGYSFSDAHINEDLAIALAASPSSVCYGLMFGSIAQYPQAQALALQRPNLNLLANDGGVLRGKACQWPSGTPVVLGDFKGFANFLISDVMGEAGG